VIACEVCGREPATSLSWFADKRHCYADRSGTWRLAGAGSNTTESYYVMLADYRAHPERWLTHLAEKRWCDLDNFRAAAARLDTAVRS
jgi:hypothetical protein